MNKENAIEVRNMTKYFKVEYDKAHTLKERLLSFGKSNREVHTVLKNINLDIKKGETVCLIGTNGSGKSTLLKLMTKIIYPNEGTIETHGKLTSLLELGAGFHQDFTGRENIYFNAAVFGLTKAEIEKRVDDIIEFSELGEFIDNPVRTYSSGMYMRLAFSIAINVDAEILLIDEILAVGDQHFQDKCFDKLKELRDSDKTIVIVSHSLDTVKDLCTRAVWIYKGEFKLDGDPTYVIDEYLKQVKLDHKEEAKKKYQKPLDTYHGIVVVDIPQSFAEVKKDTAQFTISGWSLSDCLNDRLKVTFDGQEVTEMRKINRSDVLMAYQEKYGGYGTNDDECGFDYFVDVSQMELGEHSIQQQEDLVIGLSAEQENKLTFDWGGEADDDYAFTVESFNENLLTTEIGKIDLQAKTVSYKMKTGTEQGVAKVAVHFRKGEYTRSTIFNVNVTDLENINRAAGKIATILKAGTGYDEDDGMTQYPSIKKHIEYLTDENDETFAMTSYDEVDTELEFDLEAIYGINKVEIVLKNISGVTAVPKNLKFYAADDETKEYREFISKSCNVGTNTYEISRQNMRFVKLVLPATDELMGYAVCEVRIFGKEVADKYMPLELSGYNIDIIAESTPIQSSSVAMSTQTNNLPSFVWVSRSILPEYGLPESGKITSQSGVRYQLAPYNGANAVKSVGKENAILSLNKGVKAKKIHILVTAGPGDSPYSTTKAAYARVRYTDGTTADHNNGSFFWMRRFNNLNESDQQVTANPIAIKGIKGYNWNSEALFDSECCLAEISINTNPEKEIASVELQGYQNDEWGYILAATAEEVSWIVGIEKSTADNSEIKIYPNPVRKGNSLTVETTDAKTIRLMTLQGVTISNQNINTPITTIQTDNLTTGTYLLIISGKDYTKTMKIIVK